MQGRFHEGCSILAEPCRVVEFVHVIKKDKIFKEKGKWERGIG